MPVPSASSLRFSLFVICLLLQQRSRSACQPGLTGMMQLKCRLVCRACCSSYSNKIHVDSVSYILCQMLQRQVAANRSQATKLPLVKHLIDLSAGTSLSYRANSKISSKSVCCAGGVVQVHLTAAHQHSQIHR